MTATGFDDLANGKYLPELVAWVSEHGPVMSLPALRQIRCARAAPLDAAEHGDYWTESLVSLVERMSLGRLEREDDGGLIVRFVSPLPSARQIEVAWDRAFHAAASAEARWTP